MPTENPASNLKNKKTSEQASLPARFPLQLQRIPLQIRHHFLQRLNIPLLAVKSDNGLQENWLGAAATPQGAPIPMQIADKLRGREFSSLRAFRRAFWKAVGNEKALFDQFSRLNKTDLRDGLAPSASPSEQAGKRKKFEIHHIKPISEGGAVYDVTNLTVLTPKQHIELHSKGGM